MKTEKERGYVCKGGRRKKELRERKGKSGRER